MTTRIQSGGLVENGSLVVLLLSLCGQTLAADPPTITSPPSAVASNGYAFSYQIMSKLF